MSLDRVAGLLPWFVCVWVFLCGVWGAATSRNFVHQVVCLSVMQSSTYVVLLAVGWRRGGAAPVLQAGSPPPAGPLVDPIVQALMLTDVVVGATVMALLLALAVRVHDHARTLDPEQLHRLRG